MQEKQSLVQKTMGGQYSPPMEIASNYDCGFGRLLEETYDLCHVAGTVSKEGVEVGTRITKVWTPT